MRRFVALFLLVATVSWADRLELNNGDVITGTIESLDAETVTIRTDYGLLEIDRDAVRRGEFGLVGDDLTQPLMFGFDFNGSLQDSVGAYSVTNNGMRFTVDRHGQAASALRSDGNGTFLSLAATPELNGLNQFTLFFRVYLDDLGVRQYLVSKWNRADGETADGKLTVQAGGGDLTLYLVDPGGTYHRLTARSILAAATWHDIAITFSGGRAGIYVDGQLATSARYEFSELFADDSPFLVMTAVAQTDNPYVYYNAIGSIDDLRLYSGALSPDEILGLSSSETE